jgi:hypothetical protein
MSFAGIGAMFGEAFGVPAKADRSDSMRPAPSDLTLDDLS